MLSYTLEEMCADDAILSAGFNRSRFIRARMTEVGHCSGMFKTFEGKFVYGPGRASNNSEISGLCNLLPEISCSYWHLAQVFLLVVYFLLSVIPPLPHKHINFSTIDAAQPGS